MLYINLMANVRKLFKWILCICGISKLQECDLLNEFCTTKCQNNVHSLSFWPVIRGLIVLLRIFVDVGFLKRLDLSFFIRVSTHKQALVPQPDNGDDITYQIFKTEVEQ